MSTRSANIRQATFSLLFITCSYICVIFILDIKQNVFSEFLTLSLVLPVAMAITFVTFIFRFIRWHWLLLRAGHKLPTTSSFLAYLSGFALTATPGKIGELLRIRYFSQLGVRHQQIVSAFVFERAFDLVVVLLIASLAALQPGLLTLVGIFVLLIVTTVILLAKNPAWLGFVTIRLRAYKFRILSKLVKVLRDGLQGIHQWANPLDITVSFILGLIAWLLAAYAFVWITTSLEIDIPFITSLAIYPIAMLVGAASMLPGGIGSTEAATVALLTLLETPVTIATVAAIGIRIASLWFSIVCGLTAMLILEHINRNRSPY